MTPDDLLMTLMVDPSAIADPYPLYRQLRETAPLFRTQTSGTWVISGFENARNLLRDPRCGSPPDQASVGPVSIDGSPRREVEQAAVSMLFLNPPDHTRIRGLVSRAFTPRRVERLRPEVAAMTDELLDELGGSGDFVDTVAFPLPANVISALVGVPQADRDWLRPLIADLSATLEPVSTPEEIDRAEAASRQARAYFSDLIETRRADPQDDLLTGLIQASDGEDRLSENEVISNVLLIYAAGFETTTQLLSNMVRALVAHPDQLQLLRNDHSLIPAAVEEVLRYDPPVQVDGRYTFADIEVGDITIPTGSTTLMLLAAANRDPFVCADPDRFDITRSDTQLLSFGSGIHYCLGAALARLEGQVVLERLLSRYQSWSVGEEVWRQRITIRGVERLAVEFQ
ncbi:MAG: cytochrome P450 [Acidimicrobiaceae bacterium]|nr:cytochrome P450 [Acidimicrobiaceae bacterium]MXW62933.1 cytochrome P450 [Acidimicrobiaceae bacterium]MXW76979.1 cytochrome P450 [Acidimicrobiaceae bacterium]MYA74297.1 cytochrome P450 [Acidimicrobiaceae bacterium]MYC41659.1 cytochrome P450 [Acidimicrobiaceae bacterium]